MKNQELDTLDSALNRLGDNSDTQTRLNLLKMLAEHFHGPIKPSDGISDDELNQWNLPEPLRWWYRLAGKRSEIVSNQNHLLRPDKESPDGSRIVEDKRILFYSENQGVYLWSVGWAGNDPPVWGRLNELNVPWTEEGMTLSEFLIGLCIFESIMQAPYGASVSWIDQNGLSKLTAKLPALQLTPWRWPAFPNRFYYHKGAFMVATPNGDLDGAKYYSVWIGAKSAPSVSFLKDLVDDTWEYSQL
ncbi:MAG: hypothetical protein IPJ49_16180 [Candidatus Obscuribacter sp.]|nr:hypothetical protein [Candidatus Obscuribacter sp.]